MGEEIDRYDLAYLAGGRRRVAVVALAPLLIDGRLKLSHAGKLYRVQGATAEDPLQETALTQRATVKEALAELAAHESVLAVESGLLERRLVARRLPWSRPRPTATGKALVADQAKARQTVPLRIALDGVPGIADDQVRRVLLGATQRGGPLRGQGSGGGWDASHATGGGDGGGGGGGA